MLLELETLAHEASSEKRRELLNRVTDMFLDGAERHTDRVSALYADVVLQVLDEVALQDRADFANSIADQATVPGEVVRRLAFDEIEVAAHVLTRSPVLTDVDLVRVAERASQDHLHAISRRETLSERVTDSLISRGDPRVVRSVSANHGARFSSVGLTKLAERSAEDDTVRSNLLARDDLRQQLVDKVLPMIATDYAEQLRQMIERAEDHLLDRVADAVEHESIAARQRLETRAIVNEVLGGTRHVDDAIVYLADQARITDISIVLSKLSGISEHVVSNVMFKANNEPVAILCRAVGAGTIGFKALQELRALKLRLPQSHLERGMRVFAQLTEQTAKRSLRFVKVRATVG